MAKVNVQSTHNTGGAAVTTQPASRSEVATRTALPEWRGGGGFRRRGNERSTASEPPEASTPKRKPQAAPENPKLDTDLGEKRMTATNLATRPELRGEDGGSDQGDRTNPETWQTDSL